MVGCSLSPCLPVRGPSPKARSSFQLLVCLLVLCGVGPAAAFDSQTSGAKGKGASHKSNSQQGPAPAPGSSATAKSPGSSSVSQVPVSSKPPAGASSTEFPADYIPCVFTLRELLGLRLQPAAAALTSAEAEDLKERLITEATARANNGEIDRYTNSLFVNRIGNEMLEGLTPSQALARVIFIIGDVSSVRAPVIQLKFAAQNLGVVQLTNLVKSQLPMGSLDDIAKDSSGLTDLARVNLILSKGLDDTANSIDRLLQMATNVSSALAGAIYSYDGFAWAQQNVTKDLREAATELEVTAPSGASTQKLGNDDYATALATQAKQQDLAVQAIVETARASIAASFQRPQDVGCAMSILSWNEMHYAFGRILANEYIGVQIVVRNLNDKQEFALHDAELSVDTDINGAYGRFYSARDKLIVRGVSLAQANFTPRNLVVHMAEAVGTIMSAALPVAGDMLKDATGVYNGGFLPGLKAAWADHSVDQLNLLSDIGFSSSTNYKTVVPKSGSVMFVIFIPSKQFQEGWWVQSCVEHIRIAPQGGPGISPPSSNQGNNVGIDLDAARNLCGTYGTVVSPPPPGGSSQSGGTPAAQQTTPTPESAPIQGSSGSNQWQTPAPTVLSVTAVPYRRWSPIALGIFRELAWAVVAGAHIQETQNQSAITELKCPTDDLGNLQFNKAGTLSCDLTGEGLDKIATLRLRNAQDATDTDTADGTLTVSGDPTKAKVTFQLSKLGNLNKPAYKVYAVTTTGVETFANQTVHLSLNPYETDVTPAGPVDPSKEASIQYTMKGFHLDKVAKINLYEGGYDANTNPKPLVTYDPAPGVTANQLIFTLKSADDDLKKKAETSSGLKLQIAFTPKNSSSIIPNEDSITFQSTAAAPPAAVSLNSKSLTFDPQTSGTTSPVKSVTLSSPEALTDFVVKITGAGANSFAQKNTCGSQLAVNGKCTVTVMFKPSAVGRFTATLEITYKAGEAPQTKSVSLAGTGTATK
jgi:hypothetical protein